MRRKTALLVIGGLCAASVQAQTTPFEAYDQKIEGSNVTIRMVPVKAGEFMLGSPATEKGRSEDEGPQKKVKVDAFWMGAYEVTFDQYDLYADKDKDKAPLPDGMTRPSPPYIDLTLGMGKAGGYPANSMSQYAALMYCRWLYNKTGVFFRLPTEAEWEYACRAGSKTAYPFGNEAAKLKDFAWTADNSGDKYHKVGELKPNAWGLYDMLGNVAEWTMDQYEAEAYKAIDAANPWLKPTDKNPRSVRGGNYMDLATATRSASRLMSDIAWNDRDPQIPKSKWWNADAPFVGFRIVRPVQQPTKEEADKFFKDMIDQFVGAR
ncbi:formylglycine-generating enzyme family protein [Chitinophaga deserti]|uniref:formylglycine-generating enzyme family protein n=1 Tax=Chitinophaga deserti TaxID=2164099 RepID=UPI000D6B8218|nr:SUMF1/EgtB/PvdO family nonheme iron enzyme [Chitinophaga deserti]